MVKQLIWFPGEKMSKKIFSLVIQDNYIKVLVLKKRKVISYGLTQLPPGATSNDKISRPQLVANEITDLLKSSKPRRIRTKYVIVEVSDAQTFIKLIKLPGIKVEEVGDVLKWQLEKILPLSPSQVYWDWKLIHEDKEGVEIILIAASREVIDSIINTLGLAQITIQAIVPYSVAIAKVLTANEKNPTLIINLGFQKATIAICKNGLPYFSSVEAINDNLANIKKTIDKAINFYQKDHEEKIKNILICGDRGVDKFASLISKGFKGINTQKVKLDIKAPKNFQKFSLGFVTNIGLLAKDRDFNLLPESLKRQSVIKKVNDLIGRLVLYFIFSALMIIILFGLTWFRLNLDLKNTQSKVNSFSSADANKTLQELQNKAERINLEAEKIDSLLKLPGNDTVKLSDIINQAKPANVLVNSISLDYTKKSLKISGIAQTREQIILFRDNLKKEETFNSVEIPLSNLEKTENINFDINCGLK